MDNSSYTQKMTKFDFSLGLITGTALLETRRRKKNNLYPVTYRITYKRKQVRYKSGYDLSFSDWEIIESTKQKELVKKRTQIKDGLKRIESEIEKLIKGKEFSFSSLNKRINQGTTEEIIKAFELKISILKSEDRIGSAEFYKTASQSFVAYSKNELKFSDITPEWLKKYEAWMVANKRTYTTIGMYLRAIRAIINEGIRDGILQTNQYPFKKGLYSIPHSSSRKLALTLQQVGLIVNAPINSDSESRARDLWVFMYLCNGINVHDLLRLKYSDVSNGEISWYRGKTFRTLKYKIKINAILLPEMEKIIKKWGNTEMHPNQYIFPFLYDGIESEEERKVVKNVTKLINKKMKKLGKSLNIGPITTYTARHSYATILKRAGTSLVYISESLGHSDLKTTESYLKSFEKTERKIQAEKLIEF